jgi:glycosyltransferase involved in cell wall biosynthesis
MDNNANPLNEVNPSRKKVLIIITKSNWGGAQRHVYDLATNLSKENFAVTVWAGGNGPLIQKLQEAGVDANGDLPIGRDIKISGDIRAFGRLLIKIYKFKPNILHLHSSKIGGLGALAGRICRIPKIIFTAHGWAFNEERSFISKLILKISYWIIITLSHDTIAVSESAMHQVIGWPMIKNKITPIHNAVQSISLFSQINARHVLLNNYPALKNITKNSVHKSEFWIGTIAELHPIKGYRYALQALRELIDWCAQKYPQKKIVYLIFGNGEEKDNIQKLIEEYNLQNNVIMLGHVDNASQYIQALDVFLLSSLSEGLGYVILEAGLGHVATVATAVGGIPEIIEDMNSGILVQSKKPREIAHALSFMIDHPKERKLYGNNLKETVLQKFSLEEMITKVEKIYTK